METIKLEELKNIAKIIATEQLKIHGEYFCLINGIKTEVIK